MSASESASASASTGSDSGPVNGLDSVTNHTSFSGAEGGSDDQGLRPLAGRCILLGVTGSVASIRIPRLVDLLLTAGAFVRLVVSERGKNFLTREQPLPSSPNVKVFEDADEWRWDSLGDSVLHIELRKWADVFVIAPASANTLAKLANGLCDNLLTCIARAWPFGEKEGVKPLLLVPAMNTHMWMHPVTEQHLEVITGYDSKTVRVLMPVEKRLACGDTGVGAMQSVDQIFEAVCKVCQT